MLFSQWIIVTVYLIILEKQMIPVASNKSLSPLFNSTLTFSDKNLQGGSTCEPSFFDNPQIIEQQPPTRIQTEPNHHQHSQPAHSSDPWHIHPKPRHFSATATPEEKKGYEAIEIILKNQNHNLKQQNQLLLQEVYRLKTASRKYKEQYHLKRLELEECRAECKAHQNRADELKDIVMNRLADLERRVDCKSVVGNECSLLEILNKATEDQQ